MKAPQAVGWWIKTRAVSDHTRSVPVVLPGSAEDKARQRVVGR